MCSLPKTDEYVNAGDLQPEIAARAGQGETFDPSSTIRLRCEDVPVTVKDIAYNDSADSRDRHDMGIVRRFGIELFRVCNRHPSAFMHSGRQIIGAKISILAVYDNHAARYAERFA